MAFATLSTNQGQTQHGGGREAKPEAVPRPIPPRRSACSFGHLKQDEYAEVWAMNRLKELRALSVIADEVGGIAAYQQSQWRAVTSKFFSPLAPIAKHAEGR